MIFQGGGTGDGLPDEGAEAVNAIDEGVWNGWKIIAGGGCRP